MARRNSNERARELVAQEAARIIVNQAVRDYGAAKLKAADRLGLNQRAALPGNAEIEAAVADYLQLFGREQHTNWIQILRRTAIEAMTLLDEFSPRLVGPVLAGTADDNSAINLHVFTDTPERLADALTSLGFRCRDFERRLKWRRGEPQNYPGHEFLLNDTVVQATIFPIDGIRQAPLSPVDGKPMKRASLDAVSALVEHPGE